MSDAGPQSLLRELTRLESMRQGNPASRSVRKAKRFVVRGDAELYDVEPSRMDQGPVTILLRDIGRGGVGFLSPRELPDNSIWRLAFAQQGYTVAYQAVIVRHSTKVSDGVFLVGGQFCLDTGVMVMLGIDPMAIRQGDAPEADRSESEFVAPADV